MKTEIIKIADDLRNGAIDTETAQTLLLGLFSVSTRVYCPECGSERFEKWVEGDPHGVTHKAKCKECDWIWITAQFY